MKIGREIKILLEELPLFSFKYMSWGEKEVEMGENVREKMSCEEIFYFNPADGLKIMGRDLKNLK